MLIEKALSLLQSLCSDSNDNYLRQFLQDLLTLFKRDTKLDKTRANFIMRQISSRLSPERVYKVISSILDNYKRYNVCENDDSDFKYKLNNFTGDVVVKKQT